MTSKNRALFDEITTIRLLHHAQNRRRKSCWRTIQATVAINGNQMWCCWPTYKFRGKIICTDSHVCTTNCNSYPRWWRIATNECWLEIRMMGQNWIILCRATRTVGNPKWLITVLRGTKTVIPYNRDKVWLMSNNISYANAWPQKTHHHPYSNKTCQSNHRHGGAGALVDIVLHFFPK